MRRSSSHDTEAEVWGPEASQIGGGSCEDNASRIGNHLWINGDGKGAHLRKSTINIGAKPEADDLSASKNPKHPPTKTLHNSCDVIMAL